MIGVTATGQVSVSSLTPSLASPTQFRPLKAAFPRLRLASPLRPLAYPVPWPSTYLYTRAPAHPTPSPRLHNSLLLILTQPLARVSSPSIDLSTHTLTCTEVRGELPVPRPAGLLGFPSHPYVPDLRSKEEDKHAGGDGGRQPGRRGGGGAAAEPVRVAEAPGLAHVWAVPAQPPPAAGARALQRRPRARVPPLPRPVRQDQGPRRRVPLLRPPVAAGALPVPAPPGLGQPRRACRPPPRRLRGARRQARGKSLRRPRCPALSPRGKGLPGQGPRHRLREEAPEASAALVGVSEGGQGRAFPTATRLHACSGRRAGQAARGHPRAARAGAGALLHPAPAALHARAFPHAGRRPRGRCGGEQLQRKQQQQWPQRRRRRRRDGHGDGGGGGGARGGVHAAAVRVQLAIQPISVKRGTVGLK